MKIHLTVDAKECPYWNYTDHTCFHTCGTCTCAEDGNGIKYGELPGVMIDKDRYCLVGECDIKAEIVGAIDRANPVTAYWGIKKTFRGEGIYTCSNCNASVKYSIPVHVSALPERCPICKAVMVNV